MKKKFLGLALGAVLVGNVGSVHGTTFFDNFDNTDFTLSNWYSPIGNQSDDWKFSPSISNVNNLRYVGHHAGGRDDIAVALNTQFNATNLYFTSRFGYFPWIGDTESNQSHEVNFFFGVNNITDEDNSEGYFVNIEWEYSSGGIDYFTLNTGVVGGSSSSSSSLFQLPSYSADDINTAYAHWMVIDVTTDEDSVDVALYKMDPATSERSTLLASLDNVALGLGNTYGAMGVHTQNGDTVLLGTYSVEGDSSSPVPEPTTMILFGTGMASLAAVGRRRK